MTYWSNGRMKDLASGPLRLSKLMLVERKKRKKMCKKRVIKVKYRRNRNLFHQRGKIIR